ncbi:Cardioacceleratory peptide receptor [Gryllus bimaculatus]|nr:Cardioacceleratory peptide receptor [Gryllus bimaculatus]
MWQLWVTLVALTLFVLPAFIISACYIVIVSTIWTKSKQLTPDPTRRTSRNSSVQQLQQTHQQLQLQNSGKPRGVASRLQQLQQEDQDSRRASSRGIIPKAKVKTVKMTFVIVIVYGYVPRTQTNIAVATFIQSLAPLNSAANPVIYCLFSTTIGRTLRKIPPISWAVAALQPCCPGLRPVPPDEEEPALLDARMRWASQHHKAHPHLDAAVRRGTAVAAVVSIV